MENQTVVEMVTETILMGIKTGSFKIGDALPSQRELSKLFGVSLMVIREAIKVLEGKGILVSRHGSGIYIKNDNIAANEVDDPEFVAYTLREIMELTSFIWMVSPQVVCIRAREEDLQELLRRSRQMLDYCNPYASLHFKFIYESTFGANITQLSGNTLAYTLIKELLKPINVVDYAVIQSPDYKNIVETDVKIAEALLARDSYRATFWSMERNIEFIKLAPPELLDRKHFVLIKHKYTLGE